MSGATVDPHAGAAPAASPDALSLRERLSDRLNPILVRELLQAVRGRAFFLLVLALLVFSVGLGIGVATRRSEITPRHGLEAFSFGLMALAPIVIFVVPMLAFHSMRHELRAGIVEQLLLSRLRPRRIVAGKLAAALVQYFLFLSVLAPVLATTYLLRGVDLPTIALCLVLSLLVCILTTSLAIAAAAQGVLPMLQPLANIGMAFSLGVTSIAVMGGIAEGEFLRMLGFLLRGPQFGAVMSAIVLLCVFGTVLAGMTASALLAHAHENRSTAFRVWLLAAAAACYGWMFVFVPAIGRWQAASGIAVFLVVATGALGLFSITEPRALSPRQQKHAPHRPLLAVLAAPFLPGRDRGMVFVAAVLALVVGGTLLVTEWPVWTIVGGRDPSRGVRLLLGLLSAYVVIYLSMVKTLRGLLPETARSSYQSRAWLPLLLLLCCGVPLMLDALLQGSFDDWHAGHALNPFLTVPHATRRDASEIVVGLWAFAGGLLLLQLPGLVRGVREVVHAHAPAAREDHGDRTS